MKRCKQPPQAPPAIAELLAEPDVKVPPSPKIGTIVYDNPDMTGRDILKEYYRLEAGHRRAVKDKEQADHDLAAAILGDDIPSQLLAYGMAPYARQIAKRVYG
jgi:hypothetical protein